MKKGKVTAFIQSLGGGGAQGVMVTVMNYYYRLGYEITVVVESLNNDVNSNNLDNEIKVLSLEVSSTKAAFSKMLKYVKQTDIGIAFAFSPELAINLCIIRSLTKRRFRIIGRCINTLSEEYIRSDSFFRKYISKNLVKLLYKNTDMIIAQAENMGRDLVLNFNIPKEKVEIINNPLAVKYEKIILSRDVEKKEGYFLYVGRLEPQKGLSMLLEAFALVEDPQIRLKIVGNGRLKNELIKKITDLKIDKKVDFIEYTSQIENYYKHAIATVLSSYYEGFPNVLIESIACGTPVVSFDSPSGPKDIVISGENGYLADYLDVRSLGECLNKVLKKEWDQNEIKSTATKFLQTNILTKYKQVLLGLEDK